MIFDRRSALESMVREKEVDVLIIGGGINGAGVFRELALCGIDALLVDKGDFASGATAGSSRLIHGGLRYLENGELRLVREALRERNRLLRNAPHCVHPLPATIPIFTRFSGFGNAVRKFLGFEGPPSRRGALLVRAGLTMYDVFSGRDRVLPRHRMYSAKDARAVRPMIHPDIVATAKYYDAWNPLPERLCLEVIDDALQLHSGALAINYASPVSRDAGRVLIRDSVEGGECIVRPRVVVNAAGPWIDFANRALDEPTRFIGGTKGSHLIVDHAELFEATRGEMLYYENADGRICLFFPLNGKVLIGTTDIRIDDPDAAVCDAEEELYLREAVRSVFPGIRVEPHHVISRFCGVRPLPRSEQGFTGRISRDHQIRILPPAKDRPFSVLNLIGGKWTTFRALGEQTADRIREILNRPRGRSSHDLPIGGGAGYPNQNAIKDFIQTLARETGVSSDIAEVLFRRYGAAANSVAVAVAANPTPLTSAGHWEAEIHRLAATESVVHLDDLLLRRSDLALFGHLTPAVLRRTAEIVAEALSWTPERIESELARTRRILEERHGIRVSR